MNESYNRKAESATASTKSRTTNSGSNRNSTSRASSTRNESSSSSRSRTASGQSSQTRSEAMKGRVNNPEGHNQYTKNSNKR